MTLRTIGFWKIFQRNLFTSTPASVRATTIHGQSHLQIVFRRYPIMSTTRVMFPFPGAECLDQSFHSGAPHRACVSSEPDTYEEAVQTLNKLQSNLQTRMFWSKIRSEISAENILADSVLYLERGGLTVEQLGTLNVIHVSGTKGKGTTCAFVESILRHAGLRTGFYSSPHLVAVRERIRIDGKPLSKDKFTKYFFHVYRNMEKSKETENDMPAYFRFLTCLGFYAFFKEKVDVVVLEVGIGGTMDSTNIVKRPCVTGVTSLGLEHQNVLGNSLEEIALAKAGIMKPGVPCFTLPTHPPNILRILQDHANEVKCPLILAPPLESYEQLPELSDRSPVTHLNASIAIQLAYTFLQQKYPDRLQGPSAPSTQLGQPFAFTSFFRSGLTNCVWPGRFQILRENSHLTYYLDGAHTADSLPAAHAWFARNTMDDTSALRILVFNVTGERNAEELLMPLAVSGDFDSALFCPIVTINAGGADNWSAVKAEQAVMNETIKLGSIWKRIHGTGKFVIQPSINSALDHLQDISIERKVNVLITGSLHLVGSFLSLLDPELTSGSNNTAQITRAQ